MISITESAMKLCAYIALWYVIWIFIKNIE